MCGVILHALQHPDCCGLSHVGTTVDVKLLDDFAGRRYLAEAAVPKERNQMVAEITKMNVEKRPVEERISLVRLPAWRVRRASRAVKLP